MKDGLTETENPQEITRRAATVGSVNQGAERLVFEPPAMHSPRTIAYLRVSTHQQSTDRQAYGLRDMADEFHVEHISAGAATRPVFERVLNALTRGDTFLVWDLDRAFRSTIDALQTAETLRKRGVALRIAQMSFDTSTEEGELFYTMVAAFARFERRILARRTREGLAAARQNGTTLGRPRSLDSGIIADAYDLYAEQHYPCRYLAFLLGVSRITLERAFHRMKFEYPLTKNQRKPA